MNKRFKTCSCCHQLWSSRDDFLTDPKVVLVGYQVDFENLKAGLFLFNHHRLDCFSTVSVRAEDFLDLHQGPLFTERRTGTAECLGYCLHRDELRQCPAHCECAFVRDVLQVILQWPKRAA